MNSFWEKNDVPKKLEQSKCASKWLKYANVNNWSSGIINPPQSLVFNITGAVWDHPDREWNKRQPTSKEELWMSFKKPGELFLKTT